jgi:hypothetical protein
MSGSPVPDALQLSDSGIALVQNGETFLQAELVNDLLIPDPSHPSFAEIQGSLSILEEGEGLGSRYINEYFVDSIASDLFFESDLLSTTDNLTRSGEARGECHYRQCRRRTRTQRRHAARVTPAPRVH